MTGGELLDNYLKQKKYAEMFRFAGGCNILELGSGGGDFLRACAEAGIKAEGVDLMPNSDKKYKVTRSDIVSFLKKNKRKFGGIYARHVIEHFSPQELEALLRLINKNLKNSGKFVFIFPNMYNIHVATQEFWKDITHIRPYVIEAILPLLDRCGFNIVEHGEDKESRDNSIAKKIMRGIRRIITGLPDGAPDYYAVAVKTRGL